MKLDTHLLLISAQAVPNLTPLLDERLRPQHAILLVSPDMQTRADWLEAIIKRKGIKTQRWLLQDAFDIEHIRDRVFDLLEHYPDSALGLNATGGTKPMSIAAYEVFRAFEKPIFYVHPEHDQLIWMYPKHPSIALADRIKLPDFLNAYSVQLLSQGDTLGVPAIEREFTTHLLQHAPEYSEALSVLNYYAAQAKTQLSVNVEVKHHSFKRFYELCAKFSTIQRLHINAQQLHFTDENSRFYVNGGWLEQHVYGLCLNLKKSCGIQDIARSVEVERGQRHPPVKNEMDLVLLKDNRLYLIECKAQSEKHLQQQKSTDMLYKLDTLKELIGGLQARAMLISFSTLNNHDRQRAQELGITICAGAELLHLTTQLQNWLGVSVHVHS